MAKPTLSDWAVLATLTEEPTHGFRLAALFAKDGDLGTVWTIQRPQIYRALEHLETWEWAETVGTEPGDAGPPRLRYAATPLGRETVERWRVTPVIHLRDARSELLLKLVFLERQRREPEPLITAQIVRFRAVQQEYETRLAKTEGAERVALEWRLETARAALTFLERQL